jgi:transcriptional regulator PpsR
MRSDSFKSRRATPEKESLKRNAYDFEGSRVTSRGQEYWAGSSMPLVSPDILGELIAATSDLAFVISLHGEILSVMSRKAGAEFGAVHRWQGRNIRDVLTSESVDKLDAKLELFLANTDCELPIELNHVEASVQFPIQYTFHRLGPDGSLLILGRDLRPIAETQQQLVKTQIALEQDYEQRRDFDTRYLVLMEASTDALVFINATSGRITDLNRNAAKLLGASRNDLMGGAAAQIFDGRRKGELLETLHNLAISDRYAPTELMVRASKLTLSVQPSLFRAAGEKLLLCRLESADAGSRVADAFVEDLQAFYEDAIDAIVFTDAAGVIRSANDSFLNLADAGHITNVKGRQISDFLVRGGVDQKIMLENAARTGQMRIYATKLVGDYDVDRAVEVSATYLADNTSPSFVFVIRDTSHAEFGRPAADPVSRDSTQSVIELVGNATLKDIVADTTDVIEKMCIETAVDLTGNNRVAAAEMLGLSRQSLYVKLRKFGLLKKSTD